MTGTIFHVHITAKIICFYSSGFGELDFPQKNMSMAAFLTSSLPLSAFPPYGSEGREGKEEKKVQGRRRWREKKAFFSSFSILPPPSFVLLQRRERTCLLTTYRASRAGESTGKRREKTGEEEV